MITPRRRTTASALAALAIAAAVLAAPLAGAGAARAADGGGDDGGLDQTISSSEPIATDPRVIETGHVDVGPRFVDGRWTLMIHDDTAKADPAAQSVWRSPERTVVRVLDAAEQTVPDDPAYDFLGVDAGARVSIIPQTQNPAVVWMGWNTQDPEAMARMGRGATFTLLGVDGPGRMVTYLQSGNFSAPEVLWDSREEAGQPVFVDTNTHTHANWVFTKPGVYLAAFQVSATGADGAALSDVQTLRFAVGSGASTDQAMSAAARITSAPSSAPSSQPGATAPRAREAAAVSDQGGLPALVIAIAAVTLGGLVLIAVVVVVLARQTRAKREASR